jgi:hypothetical protein
MTPAAAADRQRIGQRQREQAEQKQAPAAAPKRPLSRAEQEEAAAQRYIQGMIARYRASPDYAADEERRQRQKQRQAQRQRQGYGLGM